MAGFGNRLSEDHRAGLLATVGNFALLTFGRRSGRYACPLPTGCGKTQACVSFAAGLYRVGLARCNPWLGRSMLIATGSVEQLATIKREMISLGVPEDAIGLLHEKKHDPERAALDPATFASEPKTEGNDQRPVLLVTHSRLQHARSDPKRLEAVSTYRGRRRDLLIWDEVLLTTEALSVTTLSLDSAIGAVAPYVEAGLGETALKTALRYLRDAREAIKAEQDRQAEGSPPALVSLPPLTEDEEDLAAVALAKRRAEDSIPLVRMCGREVRVAPLSLDGVGKAAVVDFVVSVPDTFKDIAILDASHAVSRLVARDASITVAKELVGRVIKRNDRVVVNFWKTASGRKSVEEAFSGPRHKSHPLVREIVSLIARLPPGEPVLIITFKLKGKGPDIGKRLLSTLRDAGVDVEAPTASGHPRVSVARWGAHTSANTWSYAQHIVPVGVLHRGDADLLASMIGQSRDPLISRDGFPSLREVQRGEVAAALYQAMSRGCCRFTDEGQARAMQVWLPHHDARVRDELELLMPGLQWRDWPLAYPAEAKTGRIEVAVLRIGQALRDQPMTTLRVSTRVLKKDHGLNDIPKRTFSEAAQRISGTIGWLLEGQSFARTDASGFTLET